MLLTSKPTEVSQRSLVKNDQAIPMSGQRRVEQLTGKQPAGMWQDKKGDSKLATLRLMDRKCVSQL